jgi:hypothetical protein
MYAFADTLTPGLKHHGRRQAVGKQLETWPLNYPSKIIAERSII